MTAEEFNTKYIEYLENGHYGLDVHNEQFITWLDNKFQDYIKLPEFSYSQIKTKFGTGRFYAEGISNEEITEVENKITEFYKT